MNIPCKLNLTCHPDRSAIRAKDNFVIGVIHGITNAREALISVQGGRLKFYNLDQFEVYLLEKEP